MPKSATPDSAELCTTDLSHHLSRAAAARKESPLVTLVRAKSRISLAGGVPSSDYFPIRGLHVDTLAYDYLPLTEPRLRSVTQASGDDIASGGAFSGPSLTEAIQYGSGPGIPSLSSFIKDLVQRVYTPVYPDIAFRTHCGNTDGWNVVLGTFCNPGEVILVEKYSYPGMMAASRAAGVNFAPVDMDGYGMRADSLRQILESWDVEREGARRPHVLYTVPNGQNPTGSTMNDMRKIEIYRVCSEYDVLIVEDDPYFFLQLEEYVPESVRGIHQVHTNGTSEDVGHVEGYLQSLTPSFLKYDTDGRVIRLDSFSKTLAPQVRLGWFSCNSAFAVALQTTSEIWTLGPSGVSQSIVSQLLNRWGQDGYLRWLQGLRQQYVVRRNMLLDIIYEAFDVHEEHRNGMRLCTAISRRTTGSEGTPIKLFTFHPPKAGMFLWISLCLDSHADFEELRTSSPPAAVAQDLTSRLWSLLSKSDVLFAPGWVFSPPSSSPSALVTEENAAQMGHFRLSFSNTKKEDMAEAIEIFERVITKFFANNC